mmetsp:Transcript_119819/g.168680  ORF Transcript_119819/g.168680 Transcript_119819/m.168680 type:complete len:190 (-) Transcript_119819:104-673(-)
MAEPALGSAAANGSAAVAPIAVQVPGQTQSSSQPIGSASVNVSGSANGGGSVGETMQAYKAQEMLQVERLKAQTEMLPKRKLEELVKQINPNQKLDHEVEELLVDMANDFIERVVTFSCQLAKHRGSDVLEVKDVQLHLERNWNIRVPGFPREDARVAKPVKPTEGHKQRLGAVQKDSTSKRRKLDDGR